MLTFNYSMHQINKLIQLSVKIELFPLGMATVKEAPLARYITYFSFLIILSHLVNDFSCSNYLSKINMSVQKA